jgi:hypothetical protein
MLPAWLRQAQTRQTISGGRDTTQHHKERSLILLARSQNFSPSTSKKEEPIGPKLLPKGQICLASACWRPKLPPMARHCLAIGAGTISNQKRPERRKPTKVTCHYQAEQPPTEPFSDRIALLHQSTHHQSHLRR